MCVCVCVHDEGEWDEMLNACVFLYFIVMGLKYIPQASQQQPLLPSFLGFECLSVCVFMSF